ncbi:unnamed protein product, partial [Meganyctiphanes norvegica]
MNLAYAVAQNAIAMVTNATSASTMAVATHFATATAVVAFVVTATAATVGILELVGLGNVVVECLSQEHLWEGSLVQQRTVEVLGIRGTQQYLGCLVGNPGRWA